MKRVTLFLVTNLAILLMLGAVVRLLGVDRILTANGIDYRSLLIFAAVFGLGGSLLSLLMSRWVAKRATGAQVLVKPSDVGQVWLVGTVRRLTLAAGLPMPEVAIYPGAPNAFATGPTKEKALVAVSTGLLERMSRDEVEGVLAHEVSHVRNGDMVTLALLQGILNTFVIAGAWAMGFAIDAALNRGQRGDRGRRTGLGFWIGQMLAQVVLGLLASLVVFAFSRRREYGADAGAAKLAGRDRMIAALERLKGQVPSELPASLAAFGIQGSRSPGWKRLFMSHPPLEERIEALRSLP
jgi:heat shock protein HtpX